VTHERDERWAYVVLVLLVVAYVVYRYAGSWGLGGLGDLGGLRGALSRFDLGKLARSVPYLFAPLFAVLSELYRRRRAKAMREEWERSVMAEGSVRQEQNLNIRFMAGASGKLTGDIYLTRSALYVVDRSWRREPTHLVFEPSGKVEPVVKGVTVVAGKPGEPERVRVAVGGSASFTVEFTTRMAEAWLSDIGGLVRVPRALRDAAAGESREYE
jgi:hypothetical protein